MQYEETIARETFCILGIETKLKIISGSNKKEDLYNILFDEN